MKKNIKSLAAATLALVASSAVLTGCADDRSAFSGEGVLQISATVKSDVQVSSRAAAEDELGSKAIIWISNSKGAVRKYQGLENVPASGIALLSDHYVAEAWTGDSVSASFSDRWFKGREEFDITNGNVTRVNINCRIANTVASVVYGEGVTDLISDFSMTVGHKRGELRFEGLDSRKGYFMMPSSDHNLQWNLEGKLANGTIYTRSGVIENVKPATEYVIHVGYNPTGSGDDTGGGYFTIEIDERTIDVAEDVEITLAPQFEGYGFDITKPVLGDVGNVGRKSVIVNAVGRLSAMELRSSMLTPILGGEDVNLFAMSDGVAATLQNGGVTYTYTYDETADASQLKLNLEESLLNSLAEGDHTLTMTATDSYGKTTSKDLVISPSSAAARVEEVVPTDVWARHATVHGLILKASAENPGISYRRVGDTAWTPAKVTVSGSEMSAVITGLTPATAYEITATAGGIVSGPARTFTTEAATQLPNAGFESWNTSKTPYLLYGSGEAMFWDSGNHGSSTLGKNVTVPDTDRKHSGERSIKLVSQFVGIGSLGKFAAGNVFVGEYLATEGANGVLGWGRPWASRPAALKGWIHYTPQAVSNAASDNPAGVQKGDMDTGIIYIAIVDSSTKDYSGKSYPVIVNTKTKEFFNQNDANVIAYGELILDKATDGDALVEFTIPLVYKRTDIKAANIIVTASASRYGDYFTGGPSVMYLDDLELVYE